MLIVQTSCLNANAVEDYHEMPMTVINECWEVGREFQICPTILMSLIWQESRGIVSDNLTQVTNTKWFQEGIDALEIDDLTNPYQNIRLCGWYLRKWCEETEDMGFALMAWNEGDTNAYKHYDGIHYSYYARTIMNRSAEWEEEFYKEGEKKRP